MGDLDVLVDVEREGWEALRTGRAGAHYRTHLTADALMAFPFGLLTREQALEAMESAPPWTSYDLQDPRVIVLTPDSGTLVYRVVAQRTGQEPYVATISSTFVRRDGDWLLAFHQQTPA